MKIDRWACAMSGDLGETSGLENFLSCAAWNQVRSIVAPVERTKEIQGGLVCISLWGGHFVLRLTLHRECYRTL